MRSVDFPVLAVMLVVAGCRGGESSSVIRTDSAGVQIVQNRGSLRVLPWTLDTVHVFGGEDDGAASFYRVRRALIDVDDRGAIYVLDPSLFRVTAFTPGGEELLSWGREGQGPGELQFPLSVTVDEQRNVLVHEASRGVLIRYAPVGDLVDEQPAPPVMLMTHRHVEAVPGGLLLWDRDPFQGSDERTDRLVLKSGLSEELLIEGRQSYRSTAHWPACGMTFTTSLPLSPTIHWSEWGGSVAVVAWSDFSIDLFDGPRLTRRLVVGDPVEPLTQGAAVRLLERRGVTGPCNSTAAEFVEQHGFHPSPQIVQGLTLGPEGKLWAEFNEEDGTSRILVFDSSGIALGVLPAEFPMPLTFLPDGRGLIQTMDSLDVERIGIIEVRLLGRSVDHPGG